MLLALRKSSALYLKCRACYERMCLWLLIEHESFLVKKETARTASPLLRNAASAVHSRRGTSRPQQPRSGKLRGGGGA